MSTILAAIDFSPVCGCVTAEAAGLARAMGSRVVLLHVEPPEPDFVGYETGPQSVRDAVAHEAMGHLDKLHAIRDELKGEGVEASALLVQGGIIEKVLDEASRVEASYIVLGTHGHGALFHLLLGSVSEGIIRKAPCPVVIVPSQKKSR